MILAIMAHCSSNLLATLSIHGYVQYLPLQYLSLVSASLPLDDGQHDATARNAKLLYAPSVNVSI